MKIVHVVHNFPPEFVGGTEAYVAALAREQRRRGHDVLVVAGSEVPGPEDALETTEDGVRVHRLRRDHATERYSIDQRLPRLAVALDRLFARERPHVVHAHHFFNIGAPICTSAARRGIPSVLSLHDFHAVCPRFFMIRPDGFFCGDGARVPLERCMECCAPEFGGVASELAEEFRLRRRFFDAELETAGALLAPSERAARLIAETGILRTPPRIEVLPLGLLRPLKGTPRHHVGDGRLGLVFFGNLAPLKGVDLLLEAVAGLDPARRDRVSVLLLGKATAPDVDVRLATYASRLHLRREGAFDAARLERLPEEADVAVFPGTAAETYSLVVDEALALGLPVIVADRSAAPERAGDAAIVVKTGDVGDLRAAIQRLIDDRALVERLKSAALTRTFTIAEHAQRLQQVYERAIQSGPKVPFPDTLAEDRLLLADRHTARLRDELAALRGGAPFDSRFSFTPLREFALVPGGSVVVLAPHPDDEVIGPGGALAMHARRGDRVTVVHLTDGAGGDRTAEQRAAVRATRRAEAEAAAKVLGVERVLGLDFPDGKLAPSPAFAAGLAGLLETLRPDVVYAPSPFEHHPDHRAALELLRQFLGSSELRPALILYEVNEPQPPAYLLDVTAVLKQKEAALRCFHSQRGPLDVVEKTLLANRARTVNVDLPEVAAAEAFVALDRDRLPEWIAAANAIARHLDRLAGRVPPEHRSERAPPAGQSVVPVSCVISTWNKRADVRENLLALQRQTARPAEIIVVDNCSGDGTVEMILAEFPQVVVIAMPHDKKGACETFNIGFKAATQPYTAIMDDDVVAPPNWLQTLYERIRREPETTAMVSSKVVEPGMPDEFVNSPNVNRERYMATFRGCGTLARTDVLAAAGWYDEAFFIYGNERDLAARILGLGFRILQCPSAEIFHKTPFGMKAGKRSLYYHVRNFWLYAFKNCTARQIARAARVLVAKGLGLSKGESFASDATGTIGIDRTVKETPLGLWIAFKATLAALLLLPYCLRHRRVCRAPDFEPPVK